MERLLREAASVFARLRRPWALVGGLAVSVRTEPRFTRDVDVAVAVPDDPAAEALVREFQSTGFRAQAIVEQDVARRLATVRLAPSRSSDQGLMLDVLFASSGIEPEICAAAEPLEILPGLVVPVATTHHLIALKTLARDDARRPQDVADLRQLIGGADDGDLKLAVDAAELIERRGFSRSRDLPDALAAAWEEFRRR